MSVGVDDEITPEERDAIDSDLIERMFEETSELAEVK